MTENAFNWDVLDSDESTDGEEHVLLPLPIQSSKSNRQGNERAASDLTFRQPRSVFSKREEDVKYRSAILSVLIFGITLILIVTIGIGAHSKQQDPIISTDNTTAKKEPFCENNNFPWKNYKLPENVVPHLYDIHLRPSITTGNYTGVIQIHITITRTTNTIVLHSSSHHKIKSVRVKESTDEKDNEITLDKIFYCEKQSFVAFQLKQQLEIKMKYIITINITANFRNDMSGFYLSSYQTSNGTNVTIATTQFEPTSARSAFPCFDEPAFKANFTLTVTHDNKCNILFNTPMMSSKHIENGFVESKFETTPSMSTYLVALIMANFDSKSRNVTSKISERNILISVYSEPEKINQTIYALDTACKIIIFYENLFKVPYPLTKLDLVAIPDFEAGAMENWGLITYKETALLLDMTTTSEDDKKWVTTVIAHEISHQWFGNLVTMKWWNELWLNEGFASYMELKGVHNILPEWNIMDIFCVLKPERAMKKDESALSHPITFDVETHSEIQEMFDSITYEKGASIISMLIEFVGSDVFFEAISSYLHKYAYQNTVNSDLLQEINTLRIKNTDADIKTVFDTWISKAGFPVVKVTTIDAMKNEIGVSQTHFHAYGSTSVDDFVWNIPISYVTSLDPHSSQSFYLKDPADHITLSKPCKWVKLNHNRNGYYVVSYDDESFQSLSNQLHNNPTVMSSRDRSDVIFSSFMSAKAGYQSYASVLQMLKYLKDERAYLPLYDATTQLGKIRKTLLLQLDLSVNKLTSYMTDIIRPAYKDLAWKNEHNMTFLEVKAKNLLAQEMCSLKDDNCKTKALSLFNAWKVNGTEIIANEKETILTTAVQFGYESNWDFIWKQHQTNHSLTAGEKKLMLKCLCHGNNQEKLQMLILAALEGKEVKLEYIGDIFRAMVKTNTGYFVAKRFFYKHYDDLVEKLSAESFSFRKIINSLTECISLDVELEQFKSFLTNKAHANSRSNKLFIENSQVQLAWIKHFQNDVTDWLLNYQS